MIRDFFLPAIFGSRRLYAQRILGINIQEGQITAALVHAGVSSTKIEQLVLRELPEQASPEIIAQTLKELLKSLGRIDVLHVALPASLVIFKELTVPFIDQEKISMVLGYEIEPLIPFALEEAVFSFIVTQQNTTEKTSSIFTAAARIADTQNYTQPYVDAQHVPDTLSVDLVALYSLYKQIPEYARFAHTTILVVLNSRSTRVALISHGTLKLVRNIPKGLESVAEAAAAETKGNPEELLLKLTQKGCIEDLHPALEKHLVHFLNEIQFTVNSFTLQLQLDEPVDMMLLSGTYATVPELAGFVHNLLQTPCEIFTPEKLLSQKHFVCGKQLLPTTWAPYAVALGTALPYIQHSTFDLSGKIFISRNENRVYRSLIAAFCIIVVGAGLIISNSVMHLQQLTTLSSQIERIELARLTPLLQEGGKRPRAATLKRAQQLAETTLQTKEETWASLNKDSIRPLEALYELTKMIDKKRFDISIESADFSTEEGPLITTVAGVFKSKSGADHFTHFADFEKRFSDSKVLALETLNESLTDDGGVRFNSVFKVRAS